MSECSCGGVTKDAKARHDGSVIHYAVCKSCGRNNWRGALANYENQKRIKNQTVDEWLADYDKGGKNG